MKKNILIIMFFLITFIAGFFSGYVYYKSRNTLFDFHHSKHQRDRFRQKMTNQLSKYLGLNKEQERKIDEILKKRREKMKQIREQFKPELEKLREDTKIEIENILTNEQKEKFRDYISKFKKRFKKRYRKDI